MTETQLNPIEQQLAQAMTDKIIETIAHFPATPAVRQAIATRIAARIIEPDYAGEADQ